MFAQVSGTDSQRDLKSRKELLVAASPGLTSESSGALSDSTASGDPPSHKRHMKLRGELTMSIRKMQKKTKKAKRVAKKSAKRQVEAYLKTVVPPPATDSKLDRISCLTTKVNCIETVISAASKMLDQLLGTL